MSVTDLTDAYRVALVRIERAVAERLGSAADLLREPADDDSISAASAALGGHLPDELVALYRVTDGLRLFDYEIVPVDQVPDMQAFLRDSYDDIAGSGLSDRYWGRSPDGPTLALAGNEGVFLLLETSGSHAGRLTAFESVSDFGYRPVAPSIRALLECWADVAEAGLFLAEEEAESPYVYVPEERHDEVSTFLADTPCSPAAVWILAPATDA